MNTKSPNPKAVEDFLDLEFGEAGRLQLKRGDDTVTEIQAIKPAVPGENGELWVAFNQNGKFCFAKLDRNGNLAVDWHDDVYVAGQTALCGDILVRDDGHILITGITYSAGQPNALAVACYTPEGELDETYGTNGKSVFTPQDLGQPGGPDAGWIINGQGEAPDDSEVTFNLLTSSSLHQDGLVLAFNISYPVPVGQASDIRSAAIRVTQQGHWDRDFGEKGLLVLSLSEMNDPPNWLHGVVAASNGSITLLSSYGRINPRPSIVARFDATGRPDYAFDNSNTLRLDQCPSYYRAMAIGKNDHLKIAGFREGGPVARVVGIDEHGFDPAFGGDVGFELTGAGGWMGCAVEPVDEEARLITTSLMPVRSDVVVARYCADGSLDTSFGGGWFTLGLPDTLTWPKLAIMDDLRIVFAMRVKNPVVGFYRIELVSLLPQARP